MCVSLGSYWMWDRSAKGHHRGTEDTEITEHCNKVTDPTFVAGLTLLKHPPRLCDLCASKLLLQFLCVLGVLGASVVSVCDL
jgi:hypothetical protein